MPPRSSLSRFLTCLAIIALGSVLPGCTGWGPFGGGGRNSATVGTIEISPPASMPRIEMNGAGEAMVVWNVEKTLFARHYTSGAWQPESTAYMGDEHIEEVTVAMWGVNAIAAWQEDDAVKSLDFDFLGGWSSVPASHGSNLDPRREPRLATNTFGTSSTVYLGWRQIFSPDALSIFAGAMADRHLPGAGWSSETRVDTNDIQITRPQNVYGLNVGMDGFGRGFAVWSQTDDSSGAFRPSIVAARWNGTWQKAVALDAGTATAGTPHIAADADGDAVVVYTLDGDAFARRWSDATTSWSAPDTLGPEPGTALSARVAMNGDGRACAVWWNGDGGIWASNLDPASGVWSAHQRIDIDATGAMSPTARDPRVGTDVDGNARVVWQATNGVHTAAYDGGLRTWGAAERLGAGTAPDVAMDFTGVAIAVWWDDGLRDRVWAPGPKSAGEIVFASYRDTDEFNIYTMNPDGGNVRRLTSEISDDLDPCWSPDRTEVAFLSDRDSPFGTEDLYVVDVATSAVRRLTNVAEDAGDLGDPAWSPDGNTIAVAAIGGGFAGISLVNASTGAVQNLTTAFGDRWPTWSPDGTQIAFGRGEDLYLLDATGNLSQTPSLLLDSAFTDEHPAWSPDGTRIAFSRVGPSDPGIWVLEIATGTLTRITDMFNDEMPDWSPDGGTITFMRVVSEGPRVFTVPAGGGAAVEVPGQIAGNDHPDWK